MQLSLSPELEKRIEDRLRSGNFRSAEDVVAAALAALEQQDWVAELSREDFELMFPGVASKVAEGLEAARAGRVVDGEAFFDELEREEARQNKGG